MPRAKTNDPSYTVRPPGRPRKSAAAVSDAAVGGAIAGGATTGGAAGVQDSAETGNLRFEMRLPPGLVADLELMREHTGQTFANYIRNAVMRTLAEDKKQWKP